MKTILNIILISVLSIQAFAQNTTFTVSGNIKGLDGKELRMVITDDKTKEGYRAVNIPLKDNTFSYTGTIDSYTQITVSPGVERVVKKVGSGYIPVKSSLLMFIAYPGAKITFSGTITDFVDAYPSGDETNNDLAKLNKQINPLMNKSVNVQVNIENKVITDAGLIKSLKDSAAIWDSQVAAIKKQFVIDNPKSIAAAWLFSDMLMRSQIKGDDAVTVFGKLDNKLKSIPFYQDAQKRIAGFQLTKIGNMVPDITTLRTPDSTKFELSSLRGKYLIIDFWGTWCGPCMAGMPKMHEYLDKYSNKLNILGIASESDKGQKWKKAIVDKNLTWHHILSGKGDQDFVLQFNVSAFPTKFIIDPQGKIVSRYVGENESFYTELDNLLK